MHTVPWAVAVGVRSFLGLRKSIRMSILEYVESRRSCERASQRL